MEIVFQLMNISLFDCCIIAVNKVKLLSLKDAKPLQNQKTWITNLKNFLTILEAT